MKIPSLSQALEIKVNARHTNNPTTIINEEASIRLVLLIYLGKDKHPEPKLKITILKMLPLIEPASIGENHF